MNAKLVHCLFITLLFSSTSWAGIPSENLLAVGQGVASPSTTSLVNVNRGLTGAENPAGIMFLKGYKLAAEVIQDTDSGSGFEASYTGNRLGLGVGSFTSCSACEDSTNLVLGMNFKKMNLGIRYQTQNSIPTYGIGLLVNADGKHRLGLHVEDSNPEDEASTTMNTGFGYSYVNNDQTINIERTQSKTKTTSSSLTSIGYERKVSSMQVSMTYEMNADTNVDSFWMGAGFKGQTFHLAVYAQYKRMMLLVISAFF
jgi:hypothetical protein